MQNTTARTPAEIQLEIDHFETRITETRQRLTQLEYSADEINDRLSSLFRWKQYLVDELAQVNAA